MNGRSGPRARVVGFVWLFRTVSAWLVGYPVVQALMGTGIANFDEGDRLLFEPGGMLLVEALRIGAGPLLALLRAATLEWLLLSLLQLIPLGALIASVQDPTLRLGDCVARSVRALPALLTLLGFTVLTQALWLLVTGSILGRLVDPLHTLWDERTADLAFGGCALVVLAGVAVVGVLGDLGRVQIIARNLSGAGVIGPSLDVFLSRPGWVLVGWAAPTVWALLLAATAAVGAAQIDLSAPGRWRVSAVLAIHQAAAVGWVLLRARWLRTASRLTQPRASAEEGPESH